MSEGSGEASSYNMAFATEAVGALRQRRILFVKARLENHYGETSAPALAVPYLGAVARECGWHVDCVDTYLVHDEERAVEDAVRLYRPDVIALTALTSESQSMHRLAKAARRASSTAVILAGGPHPSAYPDETLENPSIDSVTIGEGEETLREILRSVESDLSWSGVAGTAVRNDAGEVVTNPERPFIEDLDTLPMPAWDLIDIDAYARRRGMSLAGMRRYMSIMTSRGCPYRCTYCHDIQGKRFRSHSPEYVLAMIDDLGERFDVHDFDIVDDIFNFDARRMEAICDGIIARQPRKIGFTLPNGIRADRLKPPQVDKLAEAGCQYVAIAIETASRRIQKQIKKHVLFNKVLPVIDTFAKNNVLTAGFFMLGFPSETEEEIQATLDYAVESSLHAAFFFVVTPFQGTELHREVEASLTEGQTRTFTHLFARQKINLSEVPDGRFFAMRRKGFVRFYADPGRMLATLRAFPEPVHLAQLAAIMIFRDTLRLSPGSVLLPVATARDGLRRVFSKLGLRRPDDGRAPVQDVGPKYAAGRAPPSSELHQTPGRVSLPLVDSSRGDTVAAE